MTDPTSPTDGVTLHSRRNVIAALGGVGAGLLAGCAATVLPTPTTASGSTSPAPQCTLTPEQEEGPFYVALDRLRNDIADGRPGVPLTLTLSLLNAGTCAPVAGAAVEVWHCDHAGTYSGEASQGTEGQVFHRGTQITGANGQVTFTTVYPGWYPGRTVHVHLKVRPGGAQAHVAHTGDVFFPQATNDALAAMALYAGRGAHERTTNATDHVWNEQHGSTCVCTVTGDPTAGMVASLTVGIDPNATPAPIGPPPGFGPPPGGGDWQEHRGHGPPPEGAVPAVER